ncbi:uncharacterized protein ZBIST_0380 [Zygosaccharomyces bailii]|nr:uncharacterized protein ZBIST_0380 [Zygosaccharomyces bailii]
MISKSASTALATIGTVCWCIQLIPQIWYNWRRKDCTGLPAIMMLLWVVSGIPFGIYFIISDGDLALQVQPHLFMFFCSISFVQTCYYPPIKMSRKRILMIVFGLIASDVGLEVGFILWLRPVYRKGTHWPALIFGVIATVLLAVGLIPPYFELAKRRGRVVGINFLFLLVDSMGAWFSIASVVVGNMDVMGIILYCIVAALEIGIFLSQFIWLCRFRWFGHDDEEEIEELSMDDASSNNTAGPNYNTERESEDKEGSQIIDTHSFANISREESLSRQCEKKDVGSMTFPARMAQTFKIPALVRRANLEELHRGYRD